MKTSFLLVLLLSLDVFAIGNPKAPKKGKFRVSLGGEPTTLNPLTSTDTYATAVQGYILEGLLSRDPETYEWSEGLATKWDVSEDKLNFTFTLRQGVKWHDGKPLTIEDVKFSFDAIFDPKYNTAHMKPYFEGIKEAKILGKDKIVFIAKEARYQNFNVIAGLTVLPKHIYKNPKKMKKLNRKLVGTGPYTLSKYQRGKRIVLKKNKKWWGNSVESMKSEYNFNSIVMRFVKEENITIELLKKGKLDYDGLSSEAFVKKTSGKQWGKSVFKVKTENKGPKGYSFIAWNLTKPLFKEKVVRRALAMLINRPLMNEKFNYNLSELVAGPAYPSSYYANEKIAPIKFDPKAALSMLRKAGWKDTDGDKVLDKMIDGKKVSLSFTILEPLKQFEKYLTIFKEDAKKAGVDVNIKLIEWNAFVKLLDERKFEAVRLAWGGGSIDWDPKQIWHSDSRKGGSNFIGYTNPKADKLIDKAKTIFDKAERKKILSGVFDMIAEDAPYAFLFSRRFALYAHSNKIDKVKDTFQYSVGTSYWWSK